MINMINMIDVKHSFYRAKEKWRGSLSPSPATKATSIALHSATWLQILSQVYFQQEKVWATSLVLLFM